MSAQSAGGLLIAAADRFVEHVRRCQSDDCRDCSMLLGQLGIAHDVWKRSDHKRASSVPSPEARKEPF